MKFAQAKNAKYYDLVRIPHGHIPAPMIKFWGWLPIPIKGKRDWNTFCCPVCGQGSFYKIDYMCRECEQWYDDDEAQYQYYLKRMKKQKHRKLLKKIEHGLLPILVLFGKVWYMPSVRLSTQERWEDDARYLEEVHLVATKEEAPE